MFRSPLSQPPAGHDPARRDHRMRGGTFAYLVHMTGATIVGRAVAAERDVDAFCAAYYCAKRSSAHYLIGLDGAIYALTHELWRVGHVGVSALERRAYLDGRWRRGIEAREGGQRFGPISRDTVRLWRAAWPGYKSPQHLFPTRSVNDCTIASEMPPCGYYAGGRWRPLPGVHRWGATRYTVEQHVAVAALALDIAHRHDWPADWHRDPRGGPRSPRLLGHEDVDLFGRADARGGWDPGALRDEPRFDWPLVTHAIKALRAGERRAELVARLVGEGPGAPVV